MKLPAIILIAVPVLLFTSLLPATVCAASVSWPSDGGIGAKLQPFVDDNVLAGAVVLVASKDKILDLEAVGYSDLDKKIPMEANDLFILCSITKMFTGVGLMMLVDEGKVFLDDPVEKYLPAFKGQMVVGKDDPTHPHPPRHPITVREVMSHTSGIQTDEQRRALYTTAVEDANSIGRLPLQWEPGTKYQYCEGPLIGGAIIEVVSGMSYPEFIKRRILDPLGMKDSTFWPTLEQAAHIPIAGKFNPDTQKLEDLHLNDDYIKDPAKCGLVPPRVLSQLTLAMIATYANHYARPDGGLFSTAADMSKFGQMLLNKGTYQGRQYIAQASLKEMTAIQTKNLYPDNTKGYGICTLIQKTATPDNPAPGTFGHHGAFRLAFWIDPNNELVIALLTHKYPFKGHEKKLNALDIAFYKAIMKKYGKLERFK